MSKLRQLIEAANRKCEMAWKVYSYNPEKDNELVDTSKAFDCIAAAQAHKREILEKNPNYTVEIIAEAANIDVKNPGVLEVPDGKKVNELPQSHFEKLVDKKGYAEVIRALTNLEVWNKDKNKSLSSWASNMADKLKKKYRPESIQYKFKVGDRVLYEGDKATIKELKTSGTGSLEKPYYSVEKDKEKGKMTHPAREFELKPLQESVQKNEDLSKHPKLQEVWHRWKFNTKYGLHYTSNAKDTQAYLAKITKPNTFWLEDEDTGKAIVQGTPKDLINFMLSHKNTIDESTQKSESKVNMSKLKNEIQAAVNKYFKDDKDLLEYVYIDTKKDKLGRDILEVRAELGYNNMVKLADYLDKIVTKYDKYAYFDQETSGIMTAVFESTQKNEDRQEHFRFRLQTKDEHEKLKTLDRLSNIKEKQGYYYVTFLAKTNSAGELAEYLRANKVYPVDLLGVIDYTKESAQKNEAISKSDYLWLKDNMKAELAKLGYSIAKDATDKNPVDSVEFKKGHTSVYLTFDGQANKIDTYYENPFIGEKTLSTISINKDRQVILNMIKNAIDKKLSNLKTESAQINESLRDLNLELADDTNAVAASADKIRQRFEYRTLQNQSYDEKQAEKIYLEIRRELEKAKKMIDACYNKIG